MKLFCACFAVGLSLVSLGHAENWPQWRGPQRNGHAEATGLSHDWQAKPPKLQWMSEGLGSGYASLSLADGVIYTTGNTGDGQSALAVDTKDGRVIWKQKLTDGNPKHGYDGSRSTPSLDSNHLYLVSSDGAIHCLNRADGSVVWSKNFKKDYNGKMMSGWGYSESPLVDGELVLCTPGASDAMIVALNKLTGEEVWRSAVPEFPTKGKKDGAAYSSIVVSNGAGVKQYVQLVGAGVIGVRASDGKFLWGYGDMANGTANIPTPIVQDDFVFASTGYGAGAALLKLVKDGEGVKAEEQYFLDANVFQNHHGGMVLVGDYLYAGHAHNNGFPICLELATGKVVWGGKRGPGTGSAAVLFADGQLVFRYQNGTVALIEATPDTYNLKGTLTPEFQQGNSWAHPVVVDGKLYLREQDKLMCYDIGA